MATTTIDWKVVEIDTERAVATFAKTFIALVITNGAGVTGFGDLKAAAIAGGIAAGEYLLGVLDGVLGSPSQKVTKTFLGKK